MSEGRVIHLKRVLEEREDQPFPFYALALEYKNLGELENSQKFFEETLKRFPDYVPTYYHYGQLLEILGEYKQARDIYTTGIEVSTQAEDDHAVAELRSVLSNLPE